LKISVVIPVRNGAQTLHKCLSTVCNQTLKDEIEIIVLNSMSTDESCDIARRYGAKIIDIPDGTFNHGLTRNIGVLHATGALVYFTVQDAWIASGDMLEKMARHFESEEVMAVAGHQAVPHEKDKNPFVWYRPYSKPGITEKFITNNIDFLGMPAHKQQALVAWDDVVAMYRKSALLQQPFVQTEFAEDWIWSYQALMKGWKLLHDSSLVVYHYHHQSYRYVFNTGYTINYHFYKFFKYKPAVPSVIMPITRVIYHLLKNKHLSIREKIYWIVHNISGKLALCFSTINFLIRFKVAGAVGIEKGYRKYCKSIPQGQHRK
jgi:rhamnosyltransferase